MLTLTRVNNMAYWQKVRVKVVVSGESHTRLEPSSERQSASKHIMQESDQ